MNRHYGGYYYWSSLVHDDQQGNSALELHREYQGTKARVAAVTFWDACGQFVVETFGTDVELAVLEQLIAEAKATIKIR